jgi:GNAT superfamily N-acetyltransferase
MATAPSTAIEAPCGLLEWDSEHFGFPIARVAAATLTAESAEAIDDWCLEHGIRCLYFLADADDPETSRVAAARGYRVIDFRITVRRPLAGVEDLPALGPEAMSVREADERDLAYTRELAARSHTRSRFYFDGGFPRERCDALYRAWVERGFRDPARTVRVPVVDGERAGYHVIAPLGPDRESNGELFAVDERHRGKGVALGLMASSLRWLAERGAARHRAVHAARNLGPIRYHERLGFLTDRVEVWHHKWFDQRRRG